MNNIYVVRGTEQAGPFTEAEIRSQLASGALTGDSMVWWEGLSEWTPLSKTPLGSPAASPAAPAPVTPAASSPFSVSSTPAPASATAVDTGTKRTASLATTALVLGILGLLCAPIIGVAAVVTGHMARGQIRKDPSLGGGGMALAGLILGYVWIGFFIIGIVADIVLLSASNNVKDVFQTIQSQLNAQQMTNNAPASPNQ